MKADTFFRAVLTRQPTKAAILFSALLVSTLTLSTPSFADDIEKLLSNAYPAEAAISFIKHASVIQPSADDEGSEKFMVLDFKIDNEVLIEQQLQASIHSICNTVLTDYSLIEQLSNNGYDMISVSFDANDQYDCL